MERFDINKSEHRENYVDEKLDLILEMSESELDEFILNEGLDPNKEATKVKGEFDGKILKLDTNQINSKIRVEDFASSILESIFNIYGKNERKKNETPSQENSIYLLKAKREWYQNSALAFSLALFIMSVFTCIWAYDIKREYLLAHSALQEREKHSILNKVETNENTKKILNSTIAAYNEASRVKKIEIEKLNRVKESRIKLSNLLEEEKKKLEVTKASQRKFARLIEAKADDFNKNRKEHAYLMKIEEEKLKRVKNKQEEINNLIIKAKESLLIEKPILEKTLTSKNRNDFNDDLSFAIDSGLINFQEINEPSGKKTKLFSFTIKEDKPIYYYFSKILENKITNKENTNFIGAIDKYVKYQQGYKVTLKTDSTKSQIKEAVFKKNGGRHILYDYVYPNLDGSIKVERRPPENSKIKTVNLEGEIRSSFFQSVKSAGLKKDLKGFDGVITSQIVNLASKGNDELFKKLRNSDEFNISIDLLTLNNEIISVKEINKIEIPRFGEILKVKKSDSP